MKKIIIVGANGTLGSLVKAALKNDGEIISVGLHSGDYQVDMTDPKSTDTLFAKIGPFDHLVVAAGEVAFAPLEHLTPDQWQVGLRSKFMGQVNLVQSGRKTINDNGSFTLTSGILSEAYIAAGVSATVINRAVEGFAQAAATELGRNLRINVVSPTVLEESAQVYGPYFPGHIPVPGAKVAQAFRRSVMGVETGKVFKVF